MECDQNTNAKYCILESNKNANLAEIGETDEKQEGQQNPKDGAIKP